MIEKETANVLVAMLTLFCVGLVIVALHGYASAESSYNDGYEEGYDTGYYAGYDDGYADGSTEEHTSIINSTPKPTAAPTATPKSETFGQFTVTATAKMIYNNSVGNDWYYYFEANGQELPDTVTASVGDKVRLYAEITEDDKIPDVGTWSGYVEIENGDIENSFYVTEDVYVYETSGRYKGNDAKFEVTWNFTPR